MQCTQNFQFETRPSLEALSRDGRRVFETREEEGEEYTKS